MEKWKIENRSTSLKTPVFEIQNLKCYHTSKNARHDFTRIELLDWVNIIAETAEGNLILVEQHRLGTDELTIETVGGIIDDGEEPVAAAHRELMEETGCSCREMIHLKTVKVNPAIQSNRIHYFLALDCCKIDNQSLDPAEDINIKIFTLDEIKKMLGNNSIDHALVVLAIELYLNYKIASS